VSAAAELGIVSGKGDGTFAPDADITRQEAAVMLVKMSEVMGIGQYDKAAKLNFVDKSYFADWAKNYIDRVCRIKDSDGNAVMSGTGSGKFSPWWNYSREQAIVTMHRLVSCTSAPEDEFIQGLKGDIDTINSSYRLGGFKNSLFTRDNIESYKAKWQQGAKNEAERDFLATLSDVYNVTARYFAACDELQAEGVDSSVLQKAVERWSYIFTHSVIDSQAVTDEYVSDEGGSPYLTFDKNSEYSDRAVEIWNSLIDEGVLNRTNGEQIFYNEMLALENGED
jgi:hypothetical protein